MLRLGVFGAAVVGALVTCGSAVAGGSLKDGPTSTWSGAYIGIHGGYGWGDHDGTFTVENGTVDPNTHFPPSAARSYELDGGFGGGQIGFNFQHDHLVFGIEADASYADIDGSVSGTTQTFGTWGSYTKNITTEIEWLGTLRGRLGVDVGHALIYGTGGFAWAKAESEQAIFFNGGLVPPNQGGGGPAGLHATGGDDKWLTGWTVGGGVEWALNKSWSLKGEYLYVDLGSADYNYIGTRTGVGGGTAGSSHTTDGFNGDLDLQTVKIGLNYKFGARDEPVPLK
jgi:outer membrane immunogenic protein